VQALQAELQDVHALEAELP